MKSASELLVVVLVACLAGCRREPAPTSSAAREDPMRCATCHMPEFDEVKSPPHAGVRPTTCGVCHRQRYWGSDSIDHPWWPLTGAHLRAAEDPATVDGEVKCSWCHRGAPSTFKDTKKECIACHAEDRAKSHFPNHETFATTCEDCHSTEKWKDAKRPVVVEPEIVDAGVELDAGAADAGAKKRPFPPKPKPKPPEPVPDVITRPSRRHH